MSKFDKIYGTPWLKAADLGGQSHQFQIVAAGYQKVGKEQEEKIVVEFDGEAKRLILNKTNARRLADSYGKNETVWAGKWTEVSQVETTYGPGLQVSPTEAPAGASDSPF